MKYLALSGALIASAGAAAAGGIDRSGQGVSALFERGNYVELSYGHAMPTVSGSMGGGAVLTGDMAVDYGQIGAAIKTDVNDKLSFALILDNPYGAKINYSTPGYVLTGTNASIASTGVTALARYKVNPNLSVHGGLSVVSATSSVDRVVNGTSLYNAKMDTAVGAGYVIGAAYERPEIALRAALTYRSGVKLSHDTTIAGVVNIADGTQYTLPQSVNFDFQTGIAANTLLMANVRWVDWSALDINGPNPTDPSAPVDLVDYSSDSFSYSIGLGRKFSDTFSGSLMIGYEAAKGGLATNLAPTDGKISLTVGGRYQINDTSALSVGVSYVKLGDATTETLGASFSNNSAVGIGIKYTMNF